MQERPCHTVRKHAVHVRLGADQPGVLAHRSRRGGGTADLIERMAETSRDAVTAMADIVWSIHPQKDKLGDLAQRMRRFAADLLSARGIEFDFDAPSSDSLEKVALEARRDLMLIFKEAIHNASRHSACTRVKAELAIREVLMWRTASVWRTVC